VYKRQLEPRTYGLKAEQRLGCLMLAGLDELVVTTSHSEGG
jgi:hypothetical protein